MDRMTFINHKGETVSFGDGNILLDKNDLRDYEWSFSSQYNKIVSFERKTQKKKLPVLIYGPEARSTATMICGIFEADIAAAKPGRLYIGDYYCVGYIYGSSKKKYNTEGILALELKFVTDEASWIKEEEVTRNQRSSNMLSDSLSGGCFSQTSKSQATNPDGIRDTVGVISCTSGTNNIALDVETEAGKSYVLSFYIFNVGAARKKVTLATGTETQQERQLEGNKWNYISFPFVANAADINLQLQDGIYYVYKVMMDEGTTAAPWRPKEEPGLNYPHNYPHNYSSPISPEFFNNTAQQDCDCIITIYGPVYNPTLEIGSNEYKVNCSVYESEILTINTKEKTIVKTTRTGEEINMFSRRDRSSYIFEKVKTGRNATNITPSADYSILLIDERSEPAWT